MRVVIALVSLVLSMNALSETYDDGMRRNIQIMAAQMPMRADRYHTYTSVLLLGKSVTYGVIFDIETELADEARAEGTTVQAIKQNGIKIYGNYQNWLNAYAQIKLGMVAKSLCTNPQSLAILQHGYSMDYKYYDENGGFLFPLSVGLASC